MPGGHLVTFSSWIAHQSNMPVQFCKSQLCMSQGRTVVSASIGISVIRIMLCDSLPRAAESNQFLCPKVKRYLSISGKAKYVKNGLCSCVLEKSY